MFSRLILNQKLIFGDIYQNAAEWTRQHARKFIFFDTRNEQNKRMNEQSHILRQHAA